ncbi:MAG: hypothetical protein IH595_04205 [Bacteroidales bacterium]|nr:hypothetical protein [Bacteroidales bacterium]
MITKKHKPKSGTYIFKIVFYISGGAGLVLLIVRFLGIFLKFPNNDLILLSALALLGIVCLPSYFISRFRNEGSLEEPLNPLDDGEERASEAREGTTKPEWEMNKSPFRNRKSGLTWGGGNVHGSNASRGERKGFME